MTREEFERLIEEEFPKAVPEKFFHLLKNIAFLADTEPDAELRAREGLGPHETLLGYYHGVPHTNRGDYYGVGGTLPDTITLYQKPLEIEAEFLLQESKRRSSQKEHTNKLENVGMSYEDAMRRAIRETIWHEVAHAFGYDEDQVRGREEKRDNDTIEP